jgi:hypothetical protein
MQKRVFNYTNGNESRNSKGSFLKPVMQGTLSCNSAKKKILGFLKDCRLFRKMEFVDFLLLPKREMRALGISN